MKAITILLLPIVLLTACTGPAMRTAKTLEPGSYELIASGGIIQDGDEGATIDNFTLIAARGITDRIDAEARIEFPLGCFAVSPRYQIYSKDSIDIATHLEAGMFFTDDELHSKSTPFFLGTGINAGKSWDNLEGYGFCRARQATVGRGPWHSVGLGGRYYPNQRDHLFWGAEIAVDSFEALKVTVGSGWRF